MDDRFTRVVTIAVVALALASCQMSAARSASGKGEQLLAENQNAAAAEHFERAASLARDPLEKARALLGRGEAQVKMGKYQSARNTLYEAQSQLQRSREGKQRETAARRHEKEGLEIRINRWIGEAYLDGGQFELSRRYLLRALPGLEGADRERGLAHLVFLNREMGDHAVAKKYHGKLSTPYSREIAGVIDGTSIRLNEARKKWIARKRVESEPSPRVSSPRKIVKKTRPSPRVGKRRPPPLTVDVFRRADWNARRPKTSRIKPMGRIGRVTVHHSAGKSFWSHSHADTATHIRSIQRYHQVNKKWADIGYHFIIDRTGNIWEGRALRYQGAHAGGTANRGNIGIVVLGNYTRQGLNSSQVRSLANLVGQLSDRYGIPHYRIHTHEELQPGHTACPGPALTHVVEQIRGKLRERHLAMGR